MIIEVPWDDLSTSLHLVEPGILKRYTKYILSLKTNRSPEVRIMLGCVRNNLRSPTGSNIFNLETEFGGAIYDGTCQVTGAKPVDIPAKDAWKISLLERLLEERLETRMNNCVTEHDMH